MKSLDFIWPSLTFYCEFIVITKTLKGIAAFLDNRQYVTEIKDILSPHPHYLFIYIFYNTSDQINKQLVQQLNIFTLKQEMSLYQKCTSWYQHQLDYTILDAQIDTKTTLLALYCILLFCCAICFNISTFPFILLHVSV